MVHALGQIHELLKPNGFLIDIHPNGEWVEFHAGLNDSEIFLGYLQETDDYIEYRQADEALETAVTKGWFRFVSREEFVFLTHTEAFGEMHTFLNENWSDALVPDEVVSKALALEKDHGNFKTILREPVVMRLFKTETNQGLAKSTA